ncbi:6993_t:CDS:2, partial [Cetraspora pellucida]
MITTFHCINCNEKYQCLKKNRIDEKERKICKQEFDQTEELPKYLLCKKNHWRYKEEKFGSSDETIDKINNTKLDNINRKTKLHDEFISYYQAIQNSDQILLSCRFNVKFEEDLDIKEVKNYVYDDDFENLYKNDD